jgi:dihydrofolate synthase / folylpolyglutamate synthase
MNPVPHLTACRSEFSYEEAIQFWFSCINYEQRIPQPDELKLEPMRALLAQLGNPHEQLRIVHVAGSKGKGSTAAMLSAILQEAGYRVGLFTSPHLCRVEERIQVDGQPILPNELASLMDEVRRAVEHLGAYRLPWCRDPNGFSPTFFEVATALGFLYFWRRRVDWAVVEVGLGGRLDSTNVCLPEVAVITSISFDHTRQLGNKLASIAMEKAGIIKPGRPAISGATVAEARAVIEQLCSQRQAPLRQLDVDIRYSYEPGRVEARGEEGENRGQRTEVREQRSEVREFTTSPPHHLTTSSLPLTTRHSPLTTHQPDTASRVQITTSGRTWPVMELGLLGEHQAANAAVALGCVEQLQAAGWRIPDSAVKKGLAEVSWPARLEVVSHRPLVVLDCAHNVASARALAQALESSFPPARRLLIFASSNDKDVKGMFGVLVPLFSHFYLTRYGNNARSVVPEELARVIAEFGPVPFTVCPTPIDAWNEARGKAKPEDLICIAGSVFLAGELRPVVTANFSRIR